MTTSSFSELDVLRLERTLNIREQIIDNLLKNSLPTKARDVDSFVNLLESVDRSIIAKAKVNADEAKNKVDEATKGLLGELLETLHKSDSSAKTRTIDVNVSVVEPPVFQPRNLDISEGELIMKQDKMNMDEILNRSK